MGPAAVGLNSDQLNSILEMDHIGTHTKPDDAYYYERLPDDPQESSFVIRGREHEVEPPVERFRVRGRRGYKLGTLPPVAPAGLAPNADIADLKLALKVAALLKRAWEWPFLLQQFSSGPGAYLTSIPGTSPVDIGALHRIFDTGRADVNDFVDVMTSATTIGIPAGTVTSNAPDQGAKVVLQMIHLIHGRYLPFTNGCK